MFKGKSCRELSDSLHLILAVITYSHCRQQTYSEICCLNETHVFLVSEAKSDVARRICVAQDQDGFSSKIESRDVEVLKSEH